MFWTKVQEKNKTFSVLPDQTLRIHFRISTKNLSFKLCTRIFPFSLTQITGSILYIYCVVHENRLTLHIVQVQRLLSVYIFGSFSLLLVCSRMTEFPDLLWTWISWLHIFMSSVHFSTDLMDVFACKKKILYTKCLCIMVQMCPWRVVCTMKFWNVQPSSPLTPIPQVEMHSYRKFSAHSCSRNNSRYTDILNKGNTMYNQNSI